MEVSKTFTPIAPRSINPALDAAATSFISSMNSSRFARVLAIVSQFGPQMARENEIVEKKELGELLGIALRVGDGCTDGESEGCLDGCADGESEGWSDGSTDGESEG